MTAGCWTFSLIQARRNSRNDAAAMAFPNAPGDAEQSPQERRRRVNSLSLFNDVNPTRRRGDHGRTGAFAAAQASGGHDG
jgi:hypothetical protein